MHCYRYWLSIKIGWVLHYNDPAIVFLTVIQCLKLCLCVNQSIWKSLIPEIIMLIIIIWLLHIKQQLMKELSREIVFCKFEIIYVIPWQLIKCIEQGVRIWVQEILHVCSILLAGQLQILILTVLKDHLRNSVWYKGLNSVKHFS